MHADREPSKSKSIYLQFFNRRLPVFTASRNLTGNCRRHRTRAGLRGCLFVRFHAGVHLFNPGNLLAPRTTASRHLKLFQASE